jgi:hypothetical protein
MPSINVYLQTALRRPVCVLAKIAQMRLLPLYPVLGQWRFGDPPFKR